MTTVNWPTAIATPEEFSLDLVQVGFRVSSMFGRSGQVLDFCNEAWKASLRVGLRDSAAAAELESFLNNLRGGSVSVRLPNYERLLPDGTAQQSYGLLYDTGVLDSSITILVDAGKTLLTGDMLGLNEDLLQVAEDCTANSDGVLVVPLVNKTKRATQGLRRASSATFIASSGVVTSVTSNVPRFQFGGPLIEPSSTNMALRSATPSGNWANNGLTQSGVVTAPDGTLTAVTFYETNIGAAQGHQTTFASLNFVAGERYVFSCFASEPIGSLKRYVGFLFVASGAFGPTDRGVLFDIATGQAGTPLGSGLEYGAIPVAGGYRIWCAITAEATVAHIVQIRYSTTITSVSQTYIGDTASGFTLWGRQVEQLSSGGPTSFIYTATAAVTRAADILQPVELQAPAGKFLMTSNSGVTYGVGCVMESASFDFTEDPR